MRPKIYYWFERFREFLIAFYRWLLKLTINAPHLIAYWRIRINNRQREQDSYYNIDCLEVTANNANVGSSSNKSPGTELKQYNINKNSLNSNRSDQNDQLPNQYKQSPNLQFKTPQIQRKKLSSIFRRLSLRNFMDYCVAALNEASSSSCSNKFDLNSCNAKVWLLGRQYDLPQEGEQLIDDIKSRLWITYRRNFPPIDENTRYTTDRGFGCMIRCGQMVLANALLYKNLSREWRWSPQGLDSNPQVYSKILKLFQDRDSCPYSIHRIVQTGQKYEGKSIGEWFGPNTIAQALKKMSSNYKKSMDEETIISIDAALDNVVIIDEIKSKFRSSDSKVSDKDESNDNESGAKASNSNNECWIPGILFIQLRLGLTKINPLYFAALKKTFQFKNSLGIIGGRPNHALYLVGYTEDDIIYLDPHSTQQYINLDETIASSVAEQAKDLDGKQQQEQLKVDAYSECEDLTGTNDLVHQPSPSPKAQRATTTCGTASTAYQQTPDETYHCSCPEKMSIDRLDPSLALCFYFRSENEFDDWCNLSQELLVKSEQAPMFEITKTRPCDWSVSLTSTKITANSRTLNAGDKNNRSTSSSSDHDEEFEILS